MKAAQRRVSAFSVFKARSKDNVNDSTLSRGDKTQSSDKKSKHTVKKLRRSLRSKTKSGRPSCLPDHAVTPAPKKKKSVTNGSPIHQNKSESISSLVHTPNVENNFHKKRPTLANGDDSRECNQIKKRKLTAGGKSKTDIPKLFQRQSSDEFEVIMTPKRLINSNFHEDSAVVAEKLFEWMIGPVKPDNFFQHLWERKPLLVKRHMTSYNDGWFSTEELQRILREDDLQFSVNIDITTYTDGQRETHNPQGRAHAPVVWDYYQNGCSVRLLNPQTFCQPVWKMLSTLQEYFSCGVGANVYLTPPGTQGFSPHYDDIEAFVLQLEGKKHWRLYSQLSDKDFLPRFSSSNFSQDEIGELILDVVLEAGDLLYFPRGIIHQADTPADSHSLHMTVSTCQRNTWGDLLEKLMPQALKMAFNEDPEFRRSIPRDYTNYMGVANTDSHHPSRKEFMQHVAHLMSKLIKYAPIDAAADKMVVKYIHDSLPPLITKDEKTRSIFGSGAQWKDGQVVDGEVLLDMTTEIKIIRRGAARLVMEDESVLVYYNLDNSKVYHAKEPQCFEIPAEAALSLEYLLDVYPKYVSINSLPASGEMEDKKIEIAQVLYERGILLLKKPLKSQEAIEKMIH